jgi:segregation and condensation protein B
MNLEAKIEAVLFKKNEPVSVEWLSRTLEVDEGNVRAALAQLDGNLRDRGIVLIDNSGEFSLATSSEVSNLITKISKDEASHELGKAGLETLAIILYSGPVSRRDIDYIRGVNSRFILRSLMIRGLVERRDGRQPLYGPTSELLAHLGIKKISDLPNYDQFIKITSHINLRSNETI